MLNGTLLARDASGRIVTVSPGAPVFFNGGTPADALARLQIVTADGVARNGGLLYDDGGALVVANGGVIAAYTQGGLPVTSTGALCVAYGGVPAAFLAGIPVDTAGRVCTVAPVVPVGFHAFSDAFDLAAFD